MSTSAPSGFATLYADRMVSVSGTGIMFAAYSFPFARSRKVPFTDIDHISAAEPTMANGKWRIWGSGDLRTWYPLDLHRPSRDRIFFAFVKPGDTRIGFTVEDSSRFIRILEESGIPVILPDIRASDSPGRSP